MQKPVPTKQKRVAYLIASTFLGVLLGFLVHALVEGLVISALLAEFESGGEVIAWPHWDGLRTLWSVMTFVGGAYAGYLLGVYWWRVVYIEGRHWTNKDRPKT